MKNNLRKFQSLVLVLVLFLPGAGAAWAASTAHIQTSALALLAASIILNSATNNTTAGSNDDTISFTGVIAV